jgi:hypothetical protein
MEKAEARVALLSYVALVVLGLLFVLGIYTNLYVEFSEGTSGWKVIGASVIATLHMSLGSVFAVAAIGLIVVAVSTHRAVWISLTVVGLVASIAAVYGGVNFAENQSNGNSLLMALGFVAAFLAYSAAIFLGQRRE